MHIVPMLLVGGKANESNTDSRGMVRGLDALSLSTPCIPNISETAKHIRNKEIVFDRLFKRALDKQAIEHNNMVDLMQSKLNIPLKPWEQPRAVNGGSVHISTLANNLPPEGSAAHTLISKYNKTHMPKAPLAEFIEELVLAEDALEQNNLLRHPDIPGPPIIAVRAPLVSVVEYDDSLASLWKHLRYT